jgi:predicted aminopeptidase
MNARQQLESLYARGQGNKPHSNYASTPAFRESKAQVIAGLRQDYDRLKAAWGGDSAYDGWFARPLNNAQLNTIAVYYQLVPGFEALLQGHGGDLEAFYKSVRAMRKLDKEERKRRLLTAGAGGTPLQATPANPLGFGRGLLFGGEDLGELVALCL